MSRLILASGSSVRRMLLENAGVDFEVIPAHVDEDLIIASMQGDGAPASDIAQALADLKAQRIGAKHPGRFVLGADQILTCEGALFQKPEDEAGARQRLQFLRGKTHQLVGAMSIVKDGAVIWRHMETSTLTMRYFSDEWLEGYLRRGLPDILSSVGAYQLEGEGLQLFSKFKGDYFAILGLSLLPLLDFLRTHKILGT